MVPSPHMMLKDYNKDLQLEISNEITRENKLRPYLIQCYLEHNIHRRPPQLY